MYFQVSKKINQTYTIIILKRQMSHSKIIQWFCVKCNKWGVVLIGGECILMHLEDSR